MGRGEDGKLRHEVGPGLLYTGNIAADLLEKKPATEG